MTRTADETKMLEALDAKVGGYLPSGATVIWQDERFFDGPFIEKALLATEEDGAVTILRWWMNGADGVPAVSVDLSVPYETFAGEINQDVFPHSSPKNIGGTTAGEKNPLEFFLRAKLLGEDVEIIWQSGDGNGSSFIARTAKVNRAEHLVAATIAVDKGIATVHVGLRTELASLKPAPAFNPGR